MFDQKAEKFRNLMAEKELVVGVGARDALEAKLIEQAGFDFIWSGSLAVSASYAVPDASLISMQQYLAAARSMNEVIDIPDPPRLRWGRRAPRAHRAVRRRRAHLE